MAEPGARRAATAIPSLRRSARRVPGATSAGRPAPGDHQEQQSARLRASQQSAAMARELPVGARARAPWRRHWPSSQARGDAAGARGAAVELMLAPRVTARGLAREQRRGVRAVAARAEPSRPSSHTACPRGQARITRRRAADTHGSRPPAPHGAQSVVSCLFRHLTTSNPEKDVLREPLPRRARQGVTVPCGSTGSGRRPCSPTTRRAQPVTIPQKSMPATP